MAKRAKAMSRSSEIERRKRHSMRRMRRSLGKPIQTTRMTLTVNSIQKSTGIAMMRMMHGRVGYMDRAGEGTSV